MTAITILVCALARMASSFESRCFTVEETICNSYLDSDRVYATSLSNEESTRHLALLMESVAAHSTDVCHEFVRSILCQTAFQPCEGDQQGDSTKRLRRVCPSDCYAMRKHPCWRLLQNFFNHEEFVFEGCQSRGFVNRSQKCYHMYNLPDVTCYTGRGQGYVGVAVRTRSGKLCRTEGARAVVSNGTGAAIPGIPSRYCRNVLGNEAEPWCYTGDRTAEPCNVPRCLTGIIQRDGIVSTEDPSSTLPSTTTTMAFVSVASLILLVFAISGILLWYWFRFYRTRQEEAGVSSVSSVEPLIPPHLSIS